jgi:fatty acid desaturase
VALILAGVPPLRLLLFYASAGLLWSTTQYLEHAYSPRSIIDGAFNLRAPAFYGWLNLHRELDLNHHRRPDEPWLYLPRLSSADEARRSYVKHYFSQWRGPQLTDEPPPELEP